MTATPEIPHDIGAERAILGAVLLHPDTLHNAMGLNIERESFYREPHRLLWDVFCEVDRAGSDIDLVTTAGALERRGKLDTIGGYSYLAGLPASCPSVQNVGHYIDTVLTLARARLLLLAVVKAQGDIVSGADVDDVAGAVQHAILEGSPQPETCSVEADTAFAVVERIRRGESGAQALPTGLEALDEHGRIFIRGKVMLIIGASGMGKSALLDQICKAAAKSGEPGCFFGLEMSRSEYTERRIANEGHIDYRRIQEGRLTNEEMAVLAETHERLDALPMWTDDDYIDMRRIYARTRAGVRRHGWRWIAIDHAHIVPGSEPGMGEGERIAEVAQMGMVIGNKTGCGVAIAVQMNANLVKRPDKRPLPSDIKYGGSLVQAASSIVGLHRDEVYNPETTMKGIAETAIIKARFGRLGVGRSRWRGQYQRFDRYTPADGQWG